MKLEVTKSPVQLNDQLFPIFLKSDELSVLLIGGEVNALKNLRLILNRSPLTKIVVVAIEFSYDFISFAELHENVILENRVYNSTDLIGKQLVISTLNDVDVSSEIRSFTQDAGLLFHDSVQPQFSDFYLEDSISNANTLLNQPMNQQKLKRPWYLFSPLKLSIYVGLVLGIMLSGHVLFSLIPLDYIYTQTSETIASLETDFLYFMLGGFIAQLIDGALGMAYGVSASTFLLSFGLSPAVASLSVHASEIVTSGVSGIMHLRFGNVNNRLFKSIVIPGVIGAIIGAYVLSEFEQYNRYIKPIVSAYTLFLGALIIYKVVRKKQNRKKVTKVGWLATLGGFLDSIGGGGWGPVVSSTLIARGKHPRMIVGSVNLAEFFVSLASSFTFFAVIGEVAWQPIMGLILGGICAAPIAAYLSSKLNIKAMMLFVGIVVVILSLRNFLTLLY